jgi:two-component system, chemotaxis family, sensor kinase Cph1
LIFPYFTGYFTKLHPSSDYKGSGVGLALCKKIMQNHKGNITAVSDLGKGTITSMYFPLDQLKTKSPAIAGL